jgi:hypothetical protein
MPSSRAAPEKLRAAATFAKTVMLVSRSTSPPNCVNAALSTIGE